MKTPGSALAELIKAQLEGGDVAKAQKDFDEAQGDWAKEVSAGGTTQVTIGDRVFSKGQEVSKEK